MAKPTQDQFLAHEALHAAHIVCDMIDITLVNHTAISRNKKWAKQAQKTLNAAFDLYQMIGKEHLK